MSKLKIAVVIPAYKVREQILGVINQIPKEVSNILVVDDGCPENTGDYVEESSKDIRVVVIRHKENLGVGSAVLSGYKYALSLDISVVIKIDGDGQMDPSLVPYFYNPILSGEADYTKGNRFYSLHSIKLMPLLRIVGNSALSFITKFSSGYWNILDPTNGYTAVSRSILLNLNFDKISKRFFFESDFLYHLYNLNAKVIDIPVKSRYGDESSNLKILNVFLFFLWGNSKNFLKRIFFKYYIKDFSIASLELLIGLILTSIGVIWGLDKLYFSPSEISLPTGTIILNSTMIIVGIQFLISFLNYDISQIPKVSISKSLINRADLD